MTIHSYSLDNGLNIHIKQDTRAPVVLSQIWYKVGSSYEPKGITGISHMLEHMMFKGTSKYTKEDMNSLVENNGGVQNAFTSFDYTAYYQFWHKKNLELSLSIESSRMSDLQFDDNEFKPEKKVVLEERNLRVDDKAFSFAFEQFMKLAYENTGRYAPIIGWRKDIENYKLEDLKNWYQQHYAPNNANIIIAGDIDPKQSFELVKEYFQDIPRSSIKNIQTNESRFNVGYRYSQIKKSPNETSAVMMGYITPSLTIEYNDNDPYALMLLSNILGGADASILQQKIVREDNLCCHIDSEYSPFTKGEDIFVITAIANQDESLESIQDKIESIITNLKQTNVTQTQLDRAKVVIKSDKVFSMDSLETQANLIGSLASIGLDADYYKYINKLYDVSIEDVHRVLSKYFNKENLTSLHLLKD